jgi:DNA-binding MarR family transcriptional regulator
MMSVVLTSKAEQFLRDLLPGHFQLMATLLRPLDESERQTLVRLLGKIVEQAAVMSAESVA